MATYQTRRYYTNRFLEAVAPELVYGTITRKPLQREIDDKSISRTYEIKLINPKQAIVRTRGNTIIAIIPITYAIIKMLSTNKKAYVQGSWENNNFLIHGFASLSSW